MIIKGVKGTGTYLKNITDPIDSPKNHKAALIKNHFIFSPKDRFPFLGDDFGFGFAAVVFFWYWFFGCCHYIKSANSVPIKLPIATPIPPKRTPQNTFSDS
ncbi:hypothetical protein AAGS39_28050 [Flavobacterium sp. CGRL2]